MVRRLAAPPCLLLALACGSGDAPAPPPAAPPAVATAEPEPLETVQLELDAAREGAEVIVQGTTNLPDGTLISFELRHERFGALPGAAGFEDGAARVRAGRFVQRVSVDDWPRGAIDVWAAFEPTSIHGEQPATVLEQYGRSGERLGGDNVNRRGASRFVEAVQTIR
jgi:hypothetical protein